MVDHHRGVDLAAMAGRVPEHAGVVADGHRGPVSLARMRLKLLPPSPRSLDERMAGTRRLLTSQRIALGLFVAMLLAAGFWAPR